MIKPRVVYADALKVVSIFALGLTILLFNPLFSIPLIALMIFALSFFVSLIIRKIPVLRKYIA